MDKMIVGSTLPLAGLTSIVPLVQSWDLFWVNQLGDTLAVSAQSAANMVYQFSFGLFSFLPSVTATLVSKNYANDDWERTQEIVCRALLFAATTSSVISMMIFANPRLFLGAVLKGKTRLIEGAHAIINFARAIHLPTPSMEWRDAANTHETFLLDLRLRNSQMKIQLSSCPRNT